MSVYTLARDDEPLADLSSTLTTMVKYDRLKGKRVVVVGGSSGIGFSVAEAALLSGASSVIISSSSQERIEAAIKRLPQDQGNVQGKVLDVKGGESAVKAFFEALPDFDHLVWSAGDPLAMGFPNIDLSNPAASYEVRTFGPLWAGKYAPARMPATCDSSITLTIGSVVRKPAKGWAFVAAIAGSCERLAKGLAVDLAPIRVNVISPGFVKTELWKDVPEDKKQEMFAAAAKRLLVGHVADPDEIAETYLYAMKCPYVTGETLNVDGGSVLAA